MAIDSAVSRHRFCRTAAVTVLLASLAACAGGNSSKQAAGPPPTLEGKKPSGFGRISVRMSGGRVTAIGSSARRSGSFGRSRSFYSG